VEWEGYTRPSRCQRPVSVSPEGRRICTGAEDDSGQIVSSVPFREGLRVGSGKIIVEYREDIVKGKKEQQKTVVGKEHTMNRMMKLTAFVVALFSLLTAQKAQPQLENSPWPMRGHDAKHTGQSPYNGPQKAILKWEKNWQSS